MVCDSGGWPSIRPVRADGKITGDGTIRYGVGKSRRSGVIKVVQKDI